jgi:FkbM family methyltransferase
MKKIINFLININILIVSFLLGIFDQIYQIKIIKKLKKIFHKKINVVFDVGAHKGEFTNLILKNFSVNSMELFEPNHKNFEYLRNKIKQDKININNYALGEKEEEKKFKLMKETSSSTLSEINKETKYFRRKNFILNLGLSSEIFKEINIKINDGLKIIKEKKIDSIDLLKIDTEGHEYFVLKGFQEYISKIKVIFFEHHYDQMIMKNYTFSDIHQYLKSKNFTQNSKFKMPFRKSFEYIYINDDYS